MTKKLQVVLSDETEEKFRKAAFGAKGLRKGAISEAVEEAIEDWIAKQTTSASGKKKA